MPTHEQREQRAQYLRAIFDAIPVASFIVDGDVRIHDFNAAAEQLLGAQSVQALNRRGGDALHCVNSERNGCGRSEQCSSCVIRNSVARAVTGASTFRQLHHANLRVGTGLVKVDVLVTTSILPYTEPPRALLILEDVAEVIRLAGRKRKAVR